VTTASVVERPMPVQVRVVGNVEASSSVDIRSQVSGELVSVGFEEGDDVTAGQVLFTIDPRPFEVAVKQAEAAVARTTAEARGARAIYNRSEELFKKGLLPRSEREETNTDLAVADAAVTAATANLENARLQLTYTKIVAPVAGRTGALLVHPGSLVRANDTTALVVINQVAPAYVTFAIPARLLPQVRGGQARSLKVQAVPSGSNEPPVIGTVSFVDNVVDQSTDSVRLKAVFPNRDRRLWAGAFVDVTLQLAVEPRALVLPNASVQASQQGQFVYVVKGDSTVEARPVKIGWIDRDEAVVESGVTAGETVVTDGQLRLTPGARVSAKPAEGQPRTTS
jgi:multidrug efflux system membrane fusion protein